MSREGNLEAPTRHALDWHSPDFYNEEAVQWWSDMFKWWS